MSCCHVVKYSRGLVPVQVYYAVTPIFICYIRSYICTVFSMQTAMQYANEVLCLCSRFKVGERRLIRKSLKKAL